MKKVKVRATKKQPKIEVYEQRAVRIMNWSLVISVLVLLIIGYVIYLEYKHSKAITGCQQGDMNDCLRIYELGGIEELSRVLDNK